MRKLKHRLNRPLLRVLAARCAVMWSVDSGDTRVHGAATVVRFVGRARSATPSSCTTARLAAGEAGAIDQALAAWRLHCVTVSELLAAHGG